MISHGASKENIVAEIVGGSLMLTNQRLSVDMNIGRRNSDRAEEILVEEGIPVLKKAVGGYLGRIFSLKSNSGYGMGVAAGVCGGDLIPPYA